MYWKHPITETQGFGSDSRPEGRAHALAFSFAVAKSFGNVQKCVHDVGRDCEAHFLKTLSKPNAAGGQIDTVLQKRC